MKQQTKTKTDIGGDWADGGFEPGEQECERFRCSLTKLSTALKGYTVSVQGFNKVMNRFNRQAKGIEG